MPPNFWPPKDEAILRDMWPTHTSRQIGKVLGRTRNSVIGKAHRMKLKNKKAGWVRAKPKPPVVKLPKPKPVKQPAPQFLGVPFESLRHSQCQFEVAPDAFCGLKRDGKRPYCEFHSKITYRKRGEK